MNRIERQAFAKRVVHFYVNISNFNKDLTVKHFLSEGYRRSTLYAIIKRYEVSGTADFKPLPGRKRSVSTDKMTKKMIKLFESEPITSVRNASLRLNIKKSTLSDMKLRSGIMSAKCQTAPKYTKDQLKRTKTNCRKLYRSSIHKTLILDDETYVMCDPKNIPGDKFYHFVNKEEIDDKIRFKPKEKFPKKFLVWQAIDECGHISESYIKIGSMKAEEYKNECLEKRLKPFIEKYHKHKDVLFWPDLATIHYQNGVQHWMQNNGLTFVTKNDNAPNVPQARPIEKFWALCKSEYGKRPKPPKSLKGFKIIWRNISEKIARKSAHTLMASNRKTLKQIGHKGPFEPFKKHK
jgi:hypothetical protein